MKYLVTGGAGFIGSHTVDALIGRGDDVRILDNLSKPVHLKGRPDYIPETAEFVQGDVRDKEALYHALKGVDAVFHFAAYQDYLPDFSTFFHVNAAGTALIYELIVEHSLPIKKIVVATSQAVAGEGLYLDGDGRPFTPDIRPEEQLEKGDWEIKDAQGRQAQWQRTPESIANPQNQYGMSKLSQEMITLNIGKRYEIPSVAMRYSIVQGPRQSFYNAYSGACRIFCLNLHYDKAPVIYEDGQQIRDFVNIHDVVQANLTAMDHKDANYRMFNVGGGHPYTVQEFAEIVNRVYEKDVGYTISGQYRFGDTRHICSDTSALQSLGWAPQNTAEDSVREYVEYLNQQTDVEDILEYAQRRMKDLDVVRSVQGS